MGSPFARFDLRTTDPEGAKRFYRAAVGIDLVDAPLLGTREPSALAVWSLHEQARARGAPAHWLGSVGVTDLERSTQRLLELGSEPLGPVIQAADGSSYRALRDPVGAVMAVRQGSEPAARSPIAWHQLHTRDAGRALSIYAELFGWSQLEVIDSADVEGGHRVFAWEAGGERVGSIANTGRWPGVHVHWLFYFPIDDLDAALERVRAEGGTARPPVVLPTGARIAACEDAQGAAFGLLAPGKEPNVATGVP